MIQMDTPAAYVGSQIFASSGRKWLVGVTPSGSGKYTALATIYGKNGSVLSFSSHPLIK